MLLPLILAVALLTSGQLHMAEPASAATVYTYSNLPLACNETIPFASTYDQTTVGGVTYYHGLSLDLPAASGVKVTSPAAGVATVRYDAGGYGNYVDVVEPSGRLHRMAHLQGTGLVPNGTSVIKGQVLGLVGSTGASTGPHVHYEQRVNGVQVTIRLEGPALVWGAPTTTDGDRTTTHGLKSSNCIGGGTNPSSGAVGVQVWSGDKIRISESNGRTGKPWYAAVSGVANPTLSDVCSFDGQPGHEFISYEAGLKHFVMGNPRADGTLAWSIILKGIYNITDFTCLDWNGDGRSDIWARDGSNNAIYVGYSNGAVVSNWTRLKSTTGAWASLGDPETLETCDLNGDGRGEIVAYEANRRFMVGRPSGTGVLRWDKLLDGVTNIDATACGNFVPGHPGEELIGWQVLGGKGTFVLGEFSSSFAHQRWDPLTPNNIGKPHKGELDDGDLDGDGVAELVSHEYRGGQHFVMVADFTGSRSFNWYQYASMASFEDMNIGRFI